MLKPTKPRPKPFPKLPPETPEQRQALATSMVSAAVTQRQEWEASLKYGLHPATGKPVENKAAVRRLLGMLNAGDA